MALAYLMSHEPHYSTLCRDYYLCARLGLSSHGRRWERGSPPGTKRRRYLEENVAAADLTLTPAELAAINVVLPPMAFLCTSFRTKI